MDLDTGRVTFGGDLVFPIQLVGTEGYGYNTWLWAWANTESDFPEELLRVATSARAYGAQHGIPQLSEASASLDTIQGETLALVCGGIAGGLPFYRAAYEGGALYFLVEQPPEPVTTPVPPERIPTVLTEVISAFDVDHRIAVESFLKQQGYVIERQGSNTTGQALGGSSVLVEFDDRGRVARIDFRLKARPQ